MNNFGGANFGVQLWCTTLVYNFGGANFGVQLWCLTNDRNRSLNRWFYRHEEPVVRIVRLVRDKELGSILIEMWVMNAIMFKLMILLP